MKVIAKIEVTFPNANSIKFGADADARITLECDGSQREQVMKLIPYVDFGTLIVEFSEGRSQDE